MSSVADHLAAVRSLLAHLAGRESTSASGPEIGRVLARDVVSPIDHPPFDNSQMDGYAVRAADVVASARMPVAAPIAAGQATGTLAPGTVAPIMTGAPIPRGADAVIQIERATPDSFGAQTVSFVEVPAPGAFVRRRGSDLEAGASVLLAGTVLTAARWGILAASGVPLVHLIPRVRVLVISSGDELQEPGGELTDGRIFDANSVAMAVAVQEAGGVVTAALRATDDAAELIRLLASHAEEADLVLTTGGVSAGAYEVVRDVFEPAGVTFGSVAMQPGGPQGLGLARITDAGGATFTRPVVAFPGNPVSALVSFEMFLRPVLRELHGLPNRRAPVVAPLAEPLHSPTNKHQVRRGILRPDGRVELVGGPSSHLLHSYATSTHLVHVPVGVSHLESGDNVEVWSIE